LFSRQDRSNEQAGADEIESSVDAAIALCDGDVRAALRAALVYNEFLERKLGRIPQHDLGRLHARARHTGRQASEKLDDWRDMS
jgi:hypothetical protein